MVRVVNQLNLLNSLSINQSRSHPLSLLSCFFIKLLGRLVTATQCLDYTSEYIVNESITRNIDDPNFKLYSLIPERDNKEIVKAISMVNNNKLINLKPTMKKKQYLINSSNIEVTSKESLEIINKINTLDFSIWNEIVSHKANNILTPIPDDLLCYNLGGYSCTCKKYVETYTCEHSIAISIVTNKLSKIVSSSIPIGKKKGPGRPVNAVRGAFNRQPLLKSTKKSESKRSILTLQIHSFIF